MILQIGEKVLVIHRQLFERDAKRHFIGTVEQCEGSLARVKGYLFALDATSNEFVKRPSLRTRIIAMDDAAVIVNVLPDNVQIEKVAYSHESGGDTLVTDGSEWRLDLTHL
jgi:hypothetical protein